MSDLFIGIDGNEIAIAGEFVIVDPVLASVLSKAQDQPERLALLANAAEIGARVIQRQDDGAAGELVRRELERMQEVLSRSQSDLVEHSAQGFAGAMQHVLGELSTSLSAISGRLDGVLAVSKAKVDLETERERGTAKGRDFEEDVAAMIDSIAGANGDTCEHVGELTGIGGKAGDVIVDIDGARGPARGRIVFEAKTGRLSRPEALRELDRGIAARDANFGVLVVAKDGSVPAQMRPLREYSGDKLVCVYDSESRLGIEVAYSLARARVMLLHGSGESGVNVAAAEAAIEMLIVSVDDLRRVKAALTSVQSNIETAKTTLDSIEAAVRVRISDVSRALSPNS